MVDEIQQKREIREKIFEMLDNSEYCYQAVKMALKDVLEIYESRNRYTKMCDIPKFSKA